MRSRCVGHHPPEFATNAFSADAFEFTRMRRDRLSRGRLDLKAETGRESNRSERPQLVLGQPLVWVANSAQDALFQVSKATHEVEHAARNVVTIGSGSPVLSFCKRIEEECVDREISALRIRLTIAKNNFVWPAAVRVGPISPKCCHLGPDAELADLHNSELRAHEPGPVKELGQTIGRGIGRDVVVAGVKAQQFVAYTSPSEVRLVPLGAQVRHHGQCRLSRSSLLGRSIGHAC